MNIIRDSNSPAIDSIPPAGQVVFHEKELDLSPRLTFRGAHGVTSEQATLKKQREKWVALPNQRGVGPWAPATVGGVVFGGPGDSYGSAPLHALVSLHALTWDALIRDALIWDALIRDALIRDALIRDALIWDALIWDALIWDALIWDALIWDAPLYASIRRPLCVPSFGMRRLTSSCVRLFAGCYGSPLSSSHGRNVTHAGFCGGA